MTSRYIDEGRDGPGDGREHPGAPILGERQRPAPHRVSVYFRKFGLICNQRYLGGGFLRRSLVNRNRP